MGAATSGVYAVDGAETGAHVPEFAALYRDHATFTWACLRRLGVSAASIDDAMQELWVTAHRRLDTLQAPAAARSWLYGIARRVASHQRRTEHRHRRKLDAWGDTAKTHDEAERESTLVVEAILGSLDARVREAFVLSELEGWSAPEIARATGANTNTIYWRVRVARQALQRRLGDDAAVEAEVIELRSATTPPRGAAKHCWLAIVPHLGKAPLLATVFASWSAAKLAIIGAGLTVAIASGVDMGLRAPAPAVAAAPSSAPAGIAAAAALPPPQVAVLPANTPRAAVPTVAVEAAPPPSGPRVRVPGPAPIATPAAAPEFDLAADEPALLTAAKRALTQGRFDEAKAALDAHRQRFPTSKLADVRGLVELEWSCRTRQPDARARLEQAHRTQVNAAALARLDGACGASP